MKLSGYLYITSEGETFDSVARAVYGDEKYAAELLEANPEKGDELVFRADERLYLPTVNAESDGAPAVAPWKAGGA